MSEGLPVEVICRVVGVSVSGFCAWRKRKPSARSVRHALIADVVRVVHAESRQTYGARRVHAELVLERRMTVVHPGRLRTAGTPPQRQSVGAFLSAVFHR